MSHLHVSSGTLRYRKLLIVIKQTAFEEYSQLKLRGQAPKALRWERLEKRFNAHKRCVTDLVALLRRHQVDFSCVNRVELDRQHLADIDLLVAVGGDGTVLSAAHFLDHGTIALLGINSDPNTSMEDRKVNKKSDERRSLGALCSMTALDMDKGLSKVLYGDGNLVSRSRIRCKVKSTFSETILVPALNDLLIANPSPAAVSRFRMGWLQPVPLKTNNRSLDKRFDPRDPNKKGNSSITTKSLYGTVTRFGGIPYDVANSLNVWSSGLWICTGTGSTGAMAAAGGQVMSNTTSNLQYSIREHMIENRNNNTDSAAELLQDDVNNRIIKAGEKMHLRWNSQKGRIFIDGSHLSHNLELGDEILIDNQAPPLQLYTKRNNDFFQK